MKNKCCFKQMAQRKKNKFGNPSAVDTYIK